MRKLKGRFITLALFAVTGSGALAYSLSNRWLEPHTTFYIGVSGSSPSGVPWSSALRSAAQEWSNKTAFDFITNENYLDPCAGFSRNDANADGFPLGSGDGRNGIDFRGTVCGNNFGTGVLAITLSFSGYGRLGFPVLTQTDIVFNTNYSWDAYSGGRQQRIDFGRVALHELGHALGLDHSDAAASIMAANVSSIDTLQTDDIDGANALYGVTSCQIRNLATNAMINDSLTAGDCRVRDLFGAASTDTSYVDVYRLTLTRDSELDIVLHSNELDPVLILTDANLGGLEIHDDSAGTCDARIRKRLPAGEYRILVNTYEEPVKCGGNVGAYNLAISDSGMPLLGTVRNLSGVQMLPSAVITGGATADAGGTFRETFTATQAIDVMGRIAPDPAHVGRAGRLYVMAVLGDGRRFVQNSAGAFVAFSGDMSTIVPSRSGTLRPQELVAVATGLTGTTSGLAGQSIAVYLGYALDSNPAEIWYGSSPIRFTIAPR